MKKDERVREVIEILKGNHLLTNDALSAALGYRSGTYVSDIMGGSKPAGELFLGRLYKHFNVNPEYINNGTGPAILEKSISREKTDKSKQLRQDLLKKKETPRRAIPYFDAEATASDISLTEMTAISAPSGTIDVGDLLSDSQAAIRIYGNSMLPNYPPGCVVGLSRVTKSFIVPGEVYVIETAEQRLLKRLFYKDDNEDGDWILCYSDNVMTFKDGSRDGKLAYPPFVIKKMDIIGLFIVTGVIKRNSNSVIINR